MTNILKKILTEKRKISNLLKGKFLETLLENKIKDLNFFKDFKASIVKNKGVSLISEIKKASPSAGILVQNFNHLDIAKMYIENGSTCLSVLTEERHFLGKLNYIFDIKKI